MRSAVDTVKEVLLRFTNSLGLKDIMDRTGIS